MDADVDGLTNKRLLILDDETDFLDILSDVLHEFEIRSATNFNEAITELQSGFAPGLIITDLLMPNDGGFEFLRYVRQRDFYQPILAMTGDLQEATFRRALELGVCGLLRKPFSMTELRDQILQKLRLADLLEVNSELVRYYGDLVLGFKMVPTSLSGPPEVLDAIAHLERDIARLLARREELMEMAAFQRKDPQGSILRFV